MRIYWGDIHNHCGMTYGYGSLENALLRAKEQLDFCAVTGHAMWPDMPERCEETNFLIDFHLNGFKKLYKNWDKIKQVVEEANSNNFVTFHSYEMHSSKYGDHHLVSPDPDIELIYADSPQNLMSKIKQRAIMVPHHIAYTPYYRGINWNYFSEKISPIVEIYSKHGLALNADAPYPYYHNMGPRDDRNTVYAGLRQGKRFSFAASTDHHAGYPGSYGDGKIAVLADQLNRESIWEAINKGRTYAVTGDKIQCEFYADNSPMGSFLHPKDNVISLVYRVVADYEIDKIVLLKNLRPLQIINGEEYNYRPVNSNHYKIRLEFGWGNNKDELYEWRAEVKINDGKILNYQTGFRGRNILAPDTTETDAFENINDVENKVMNCSNDQIDWQCFTLANFSTLHPNTSQMILEIEADPDADITLTVNDKEHRIRLSELLQSGFTWQTKTFASQAYKIYRAIPESHYCISGEKTDTAFPGDFYHLEVYQKNGSCAFVSPVFIE